MRIQTINQYKENCPHKLYGLFFERTNPKLSDDERHCHASVKHNRFLKSTITNYCVSQNMIMPFESKSIYYSQIGTQLINYYCEDFDKVTYRAIGINKLIKNAWDTNSNIKQEVNETKVGKIIKGAYQIDANSAYLRHAQGPLPTKVLAVFNNISEAEVYRKKENIYSTTTMLIKYETGSLSFLKPMLEIGIQSVYVLKLELIPGMDRFYKEFYKPNMDLNDKDIKATIKKITVAGLGNKSKNSLTVPYIWYKQGQEIERMKRILKQNGCTLLKIHTDSIAWTGQKGLEALREYIESGDYKIEHNNERVYIVHQSCYQYEGDRPKGLTNITNISSGLIEYDDGKKVSLDKFPCLRYGRKVLVDIAGVATWQILGDNMKGVDYKKIRDDKAKSLRRKIKETNGKKKKK